MKTIITRIGLRAFSFGMAALFMMPAVFAQEAEGGAVAQKSMLDKWVIDGGWTMIPLVVLLAATIFLIVFCMMALTKEKFCPEELRSQMLALMSECRVQSAIQLSTTSPTFLGRLES